MERKKPTTTTADAVSPFRDNPVVPKEKKRSSTSASRGGALTPTVMRFSVIFVSAQKRASFCILHFLFFLPPPGAFGYRARVCASVCLSLDLKTIANAQSRNAPQMKEDVRENTPNSRHPKTTVAFGRTTPVRDLAAGASTTRNTSTSPKTTSPLPSSMKRDKIEYVSPKYTNAYAREHSRVSRIVTESAKPAPSPRVKRAMEYARRRMMETTSKTSAGVGGSESTSERVARILAAAKAKVNGDAISNGGVVFAPPAAPEGGDVADARGGEEEAAAETEKKKEPECVEEKVEDVVVAPPEPKVVVVAAAEVAAEVGVKLATREEEQKEEEEVVVAPIPAPPPPPSALTRAVAFKSLATKKESFKSLPNANQSAFWLRKCNAALVRGDEEGACLALRTGISRKAEPTEELKEKLKELVTMKMNEAIEASEKTEEVQKEEEKEEKVQTPKEETVAKEIAGDAAAPRSASSSEEFEFKTIQKAETADFAQAAIERENKLIVSEAMAMIVRESPTTEVPRRQSMDNKSQRRLKYEGSTPPPASTQNPAAIGNNQADEEFAFRVSPMPTEDARKEEVGDQQPAPPSPSSPPSASPLTIFARLMGKIITDTLELTDEAAKKAAIAAQSPPPVSSPEPYVSPAVLNSPHISPRSPIRRQHSLDMKKFYEQEERDEEQVEAVGEERTPSKAKDEQQQPELSPSKTPWSKLKKVKDVKSERKSKKKSATPARRPKLDR